MKNNNKMSKVQSLVLSFAMVAGGVAPAFATSPSATSNSHSSAIGVGTGGTSNVAVGGQNTTVGGQTMGGQAMGGQTTSISTPRQIYPGFAPSIFNAPAGACGEGFGLSAGGPFSSLGGGRSWQSDGCMDRLDNRHIMDVGTVLATQPDLNLRREGKNLVGVGLRSQMEKSPALKGAAEGVASNAQLDCVKKAEQEGSLSIVMMTQDLTCDAEGKVAIKPKAVEKPKSKIDYSASYPGRQF